MKLQQLRYVIAVADAGSINEAARQLFVAQPSLSASIREVENELGFEIFNRNSRGVTLSREGSEFVSYAKQVTEQMSNLERRFLRDKQETQFLSVSAQHYAFVVQALIEFIKEKEEGGNAEKYDFSVRECRTSEVIEDVKTFKSDIGILMTSRFNHNVMMRFFRENHMEFVPVTTSRPHVFLSDRHPLAKKERIGTNDLSGFPYLCYQQNLNDSLYFSEELFSDFPASRRIYVDDRASIFNLMRGLDGFTIGSRFSCKELNGSDIVTIPFEEEEEMTVGYVKLEHAALSDMASDYLKKLSEILTRSG